VAGQGVLVGERDQALLVEHLAPSISDALLLEDGEDLVDGVVVKEFVDQRDGSRVGGV